MDGGCTGRENKETPCGEEEAAERARSTKNTSRPDPHPLFSTQPTGTSAAFSAYAAVFDGHGGYATADWLVANLATLIDKAWAAEGGAASPERALTAAFLAADRKLLAPGGFMGMGERGIGGAKCGSTAAVVGLVSLGGVATLVAANVGDARALLVRLGPDGKAAAASQLTVDHVPDAEEERKRIERTNPNPKLPLVRYVGGTWRCGGILALSRAFGDAYMKGSLQFEGVSAGSDGYASGFGVIAQLDISFTPLEESKGSSAASWVVVASDGLFANSERGGGGGLSNEEVGSVVAQVVAAGGGADGVAGALTASAQAAGSTDDVTVVCMRL